MSVQENSKQFTNIPNSYRNINYKIIMCGVVVWEILIAGTFTYLSVSQISNHPDYWLEFILTAVPWGCIGLYEVAHTAIMAFALRHLRNNFVQVLDKKFNYVYYYYYWTALLLMFTFFQYVNSKVRKSIETGALEVDFAKWQSLVHSIRRQGAILSQYLTPAQLSSLAQTIILCTFCTFSALKLTANGALQSFDRVNDIKVLAGSVVFEVWLMVSLYYKVVLAQNVTNEVRQVF